MNIVRYRLAPALLGIAIAGCGHDQPANTAQNPPPETNTTTSAQDQTAPATSPANPPLPQTTSAQNRGAPATSPANTQSSETSAQERSDPATNTAISPSSVTSMQGGVNTPNAAAITDDQILGLIHAADRGEIEQARLAESKSKDPRVKKFAAKMIHDHTDADTKGELIARKENLTLASSPTRSSLENDARSATMSLQSQDGTAFDRLYADTQVHEHQSVLDLIDQKLLPAATDPKVKEYLTSVRAKVSMHLQHARDLRAKLQQSP